MQTHLELWDWRRRIAALYASVRSVEPPRRAWELWRETRDSLFGEHDQSPLGAAERATFQGLPLFEYDPALRFVVDLAPIARSDDDVVVPGGADGDIRMAAFARTSGLAPALGGELTLYWVRGYGGGAFLPFRDATTGRETFGGGRYLLDSIKGADLGLAPCGRAILDFNFAYNPSCAYSDRWVCPLAPPENVLPAEIRGGERVPG